MPCNGRRASIRKTDRPRIYGLYNEKSQAHVETGEAKCFTWYLFHRSSLANEEADKLQTSPALIYHINILKKTININIHTLTKTLQIII
ncbi:hypothetical protein GCM10023189_32950 [Nibrella saemangeumensis]|uniref:RNase H type-1 domain-containing protein n=1 Tax=Nibrella saemangeumensis TaxID=1084526 RepID=A0ABP8N4G3_9BACT